MNQTWTADPNIISDAFHAAITEGAVLTLSLTDGSLKTTRALKLHPHQGKKYFIIQRPPDLPESVLIRAVLFKNRELPILSFPCTTSKRSEKLLAFPVPRELFFTQRRRHPRFLAPQGSIASFFMDRRERASVCLMKDISMGGAKLQGSPVSRLNPQELIGPTTLTLSGYEALITREITLHKARVVRIRNSNTMEMGINFLLNNKEKQQLSSHLHYLTKESPFPFAEAPFTI